MLPKFFLQFYKIFPILHMAVILPRYNRSVRMKTEDLIMLVVGLLVCLLPLALGLFAAFYGVG